MSHTIDGINPDVTPSGEGCVECLQSGQWWLHLRRCAECGHIGCCDTSPNRHATAHYHQSGHAILSSFEPGESWFYDYRNGDVFDGPTLAGPHMHPPGQPVPGPAGRVPPDWETLLHD